MEPDDRDAIDAELRAIDQRAARYGLERRGPFGGINPLRADAALPPRLAAIREEIAGEIAASGRGPGTEAFRAEREGHHEGDDER